MKTKLMMAIACASLSWAALASAQPNGLRTQAYEYGWDAAQNFCVDLRPRRFRTTDRRSITETFSRFCKRGFDDHINSNRACQRRLRERNAYTYMWETRRSTCE